MHLRNGSATLMRGKSLTYRKDPFPNLPVSDQNRFLDPKKKKARCRQVKDLPRIRVAESSAEESST